MLWVHTYSPHPFAEGCTQHTLSYTLISNTQCKVHSKNNGRPDVHSVQQIKPGCQQKQTRLRSWLKTVTPTCFYSTVSLSTGVSTHPQASLPHPLSSPLVWWLVVRRALADQGSMHVKGKVVSLSHLLIFLSGIIRFCPKRAHHELKLVLRWGCQYCIGDCYTAWLFPVSELI